MKNDFFDNFRKQVIGTKKFRLTPEAVVILVLAMLSLVITFLDLPPLFDVY
ncbi:MAG TPA: hypothetical protein VD816_18680 [Ohtaekwangia sp.]|nr:hypothetical protein [Ohtaekwangia sp.]